VSPGVAPEKDSKQRQWEAGCVTHSLGGNILNPLREKDLWKMTSERMAYFMSFSVRDSDTKNGKLAARRLFGEGI
jgi:hypothetical protein